MDARLRLIAQRLGGGYWFVPALMCLAALALAGLTTVVDDRLDPGLLPDWLVYAGGNDGAAEILGTVAASMMTVASLVFSITMVVLTLASGQFGPRLISSFMADRGSQFALGGFLGAFLYALVALRFVRSAAEDRPPSISVTVGLLMALAGVALLIFYIHHIAVTIQAQSLVARIAADVRTSSDRLFPSAFEAEPPSEQREMPAAFEESSAVVPAGGSGYVDVVDLDALVELARRHDLVVRLLVRPGRFVARGEPVALAWPQDRVDEQLSDRVAGCLTTGRSRTNVQDIDFPLKQLAEVAVRALSPAINDPFTANNCVDQLSAILLDLARTPFPGAQLADQDGRLRVEAADRVTLEGLVGGAFDGIRQCAGQHASVYAHLLEALVRVGREVPAGPDLDAVVREGRLVVERAQQALPQAEDLRAVRERYDELLAVTASPRP